MKLTTCAVAAAVITILFVTFGAQANSDQDADPVAPVPAEPIAQVLPQEPPAQTPPQPIEIELKPSFWDWLWAFYKKNHEPIQTLLLFITAVGSLIFAERRLRIARQDALSRDRDARTRDRDARTNSANAVATAYTQALTQLGWTDSNGNPVIEGRLGAIYALETIAKNNTGYRRQIIHVLCAYVRLHTNKYRNKDYIKGPYRASPREDIQGVFNVFSLDSGADWINSVVSDREYLSFKSCYLQGLKFIPKGLLCSFFDADLIGVFFVGSVFKPGSSFVRCSLQGAFLHEATLKFCDWDNATFKDTNSDGSFDDLAQLNYADICNSEFLTPEQLEGLDLSTTKRDKHLACGQSFPDGNDDPD